MTRVLHHVRSLWGAWWPLPFAFFAAYCAFVSYFGDLRIEHIVISAAVWITAYWSPRTKRFLVDMFPFVLLGLGYDLVRYGRQLFVRPENVISCGLRDLELALFSVGPGVTPQDYFMTHHAPAIDLLAAVPYTVFVYFAFAYGVYLFFVDRPRSRYFLWSMALANYVSYVMWLVVPAAPPWYIRQSGCAVDLSALPNPGALARVDELLGITYYHDFYSRAASVFGAMPSMHCAYPMLGLLTAWQAINWKTKPLHIIYVLWMFAAAVYLDHHWITDALVGWLVAIGTVVVVRYVLRKVDERREAIVEQTAGGAATPATELVWKQEVR